MNQPEKRVFLYNTTPSDSLDITQPVNTTNKTGQWSQVGIEKGYASVAAAITNENSEYYLQPRPFFETLHHGGTLGEAFLYASPTVSGVKILVGDPLLTAKFPASLPLFQDPDYDHTQSNDTIRRTKLMIENGLTYGARQVDLLDSMKEAIIATADMDIVMELLTPLNKWALARTMNYYMNIYSSTTSAWSRYILESTGLTAEQWIARNHQQVSDLFNQLLTKIGVAIDSAYVSPSGQWMYEFTYEHPVQTLVNVFFTIQVYSDIGLTTLVKTVNSTDVDGWYYEKEYSEFFAMPATGFPSNLTKRRVQFISQALDYLTPKEIYYIKWTAYYSNGTLYESSADRLIIHGE
jgi:hypothetical protein